MVQEGGAKKKGKGKKGKKDDGGMAQVSDADKDEMMAVQNEEGATALMLACQREEVDHVRALLEKGGAVRMTDYSGKTALHYCVENSNPAIAELVISKDPSLLDRRDNEGYAPLHLSVIANNKKMIDTLIDNGADVGILDHEGHNTIHWATVCGHVDLIDYLQDRGAKLNRPDAHNAFALHYAAQMCGVKAGDETDPRVGRKMLSKLLEKDVDVDCRDQDKRTPLIWAASSGSKDAMEALIAVGASSQSSDKDGLTAMHCAASRGHSKCVELLMKQGANVDATDKNGCTPLFYAVTLGHDNCAKTLLKNNANPSHKDNRGRTPAHCAAAKGSRSAIKMLKSHNADLWMPNKKGERPVHEAALAKETDTVKYLLDKTKEKESVNASNSDNRSILHIAAITNNIRLCKLLVSKGAKNNTTMRHKKVKDKKLSPYQAAVLKGSMETAEYLAPITDPPSDIDDEEWEDRRRREREKELIRQRERELQLKQEEEERKDDIGPMSKTASSTRRETPRQDYTESGARQALRGNESSRSYTPQPSPSISINLNTPEPLAEVEEIGLGPDALKDINPDMVREPTFTTFGTVTPSRFRSPSPTSTIMEEEPLEDQLPTPPGFREQDSTTPKQGPSGDAVEQIQEVDPEGKREDQEQHADNPQMNRVKEE